MQASRAVLLFLALSLAVGCGDNSDRGGDENLNNTPCPADQRLVDGICFDEPPPCGGPPSPHCQSDMGEDECWANRGYYQCTIHNVNCWCECPAGDRGCPCWHADHCQGACMGDQTDDCQDTYIGHCSDRIVFHPLGCNCFYNGWEGGFFFTCAD